MRCTSNEATTWTIFTIRDPIIACIYPIYNSMPPPNINLAQKLQVPLPVTIPMRIGNFVCVTAVLTFTSFPSVTCVLSISLCMSPPNFDATHIPLAVTIVTRPCSDFLLKTTAERMMRGILD
jgi:hypothetical protein